jgi:hypothetical protein
MRLRLAALGLAVASAANAQSVSVTFGPNLQALQPRIDAAEQWQEAQFRRFGPLETGSRLARAGSAQVKWAAAAAAPDLANFGMASLAAGFATDGLRKARLTQAQVRLRLDSLSVPSHPIARLNGNSARASGVVERLNPDGSVAASYPIFVNAVFGYSTGVADDRRGWQFNLTDESTRVGPTLAAFVHKALSRAYPDESFPKPVLVTPTPGLRIYQLAAVWR